jgi:hypothetical protein
VGGVRAFWPSATFDAQGHLWLAWEEEPVLTVHTAQFQKVDSADPWFASLEDAASPVVASGGAAGPAMLFVDESRRVPRVVKRQ